MPHPPPTKGSKVRLLSANVKAKDLCDSWAASAICTEEPKTESELKKKKKIEDLLLGGSEDMFCFNQCHALPHLVKFYVLKKPC